MKILALVFSLSAVAFAPIPVMAQQTPAKPAAKPAAKSSTTTKRAPLARSAA